LVSYGIDKSQHLNSFLETLEKKKVSKLTVLKTLIDQGATEKEIADYDFDTWCRSHRALQAYRLLCVAPRNWEMDMTVIYGPTGTGKSRLCNEEFPGCYWKQRGKWWDNYASQDVVVLDEFYGWFTWDFILRLLDRYPLSVETKGGAVQFVARKIIFTSNSHPKEWYPKMGERYVWGADPVRNPLERRLTKIIQIHPPPPSSPPPFPLFTH